MAWFDELENDDLKAAATAKGWDKKEAEEVAREATKAYRALEKLHGVPAEMLFKIPTDPKDPAWEEFRSKLPKPAPEEYTFDGLKFKTGDDPDPDFTKRMRDLSHELGLTPAQAKRVTQSFMELADVEIETEANEKATLTAAEKSELMAQWGANYDRNLFIAQKAADAMGLGKEVIDAIQGSAGYAKTMEAFRLIGSRMGEATFLGGNQGGGQNDGAFTVQQAEEQKEALMKDIAWRQKWYDGDVRARQQIADLDRIIAASKVPNAYRPR